MDCEFNKYGCTSKVAPEDMQAHLQQQMSTHLQLVTTRLEAEIQKNKTLEARINELERPQQPPKPQVPPTPQRTPSQLKTSKPAPMEPPPFEKGIVWSYDAVTDEWMRGAVSFQMEQVSFDEGALTKAHMVVVKEPITDASDSPPDILVLGNKKLKADLPSCVSLSNKLVGKVMKTPGPIERIFEDARMKMVCMDFETKYNAHHPPKSIHFWPSWVLEMPLRGQYCILEPYIELEFRKMSSSHGYILSDRNTPQSFSHFTYEESKHTLLVIDLQSVSSPGDYYYDPQIHTSDGIGFGLGNLGRAGIDRFLKTHRCNAICNYLKLPVLNFSEPKRLPVLKKPSIEGRLAKGTTAKWEGPFDISTGECAQTLSGHDDRVVCLCVTSAYLLAGSASGDLKVYNLPDFSIRGTFNVHRKSVNSIVANDTHIFTGSSDHSIKVWSKEFKLEYALRDHVGEVNALALADSPLNYIISASFDKKIKVWDMQATCCLYAFEAHEGWVKSLAVKDNLLFSGSFDFSAKEWDLSTFNEVRAFADHSDNISAVLTTDKFMVTASEDKIVKFWDYRRTWTPATHKQHPKSVRDTIYCVLLIEKRQRWGIGPHVLHKIFAMVAYDRNTKCLASIKGHRLGVQALATDGRHIFTGSDDCTVKVWKFKPKA